MNNTLRVFLPKQCLRGCDDGLLFGFINKSHTFCCITAILPLPNKQNCAFRLHNPTSDSTFGVVGVFEKDKDHVDAYLRKLSPLPMIRIRNSDGKLTVAWNSGCEISKQHSTDGFVVVTYDAERFNQSVFTDVAGKELTAIAGQSNLDLIKHSFSCHHWALKSVLKDEEVDCMKDFTLSRKSYFEIATSFLFTVAFRLTSLLLYLVSFITSFSIFHFPAVQMVLAVPAMCNQMRLKWSIVSRRLQTVSASQKHRLCFTSSLWLHMFDVLVGISLMIYLLHGNKAATVAESLLSAAGTVATELESLLNWMMGVPAGLKLNQPLAQFLGKFFLYHIFLWKAYLKALEPFAGTVLLCSCLTGCLGFTVQLTVAQDVFSMMTLHIYCFYVYAARLYNLQVYALSSLWRLFRGKKWNVLRKRVDSAVYDIDQLFLGTLVFTILLFLLPTTALFYAVFALLRIRMLVCQGILSKVVSVISSLPIYWLVLRLVQPAVISNDIHVSVVQHLPLCIELQLKPVSVAELYRADASTEENNTPQSPDANTSWKSLVHKLLVGQLIYPWIPSSYMH